MFWSRIGGDEGYGCMIGVSRNGGLSSKRSRLGFRRDSGNPIQVRMSQAILFWCIYHNSKANNYVYEYFL
ncbi:hypothetical protein Hanom_Chr01g00047581 [Helianthus anomalus]